MSLYGRICEGRQSYEYDNGMSCEGNSSEYREKCAQEEREKKLREFFWNLEKYPEKFPVEKVSLLKEGKKVEVKFFYQEGGYFTEDFAIRNGKLSLFWCKREFANLKEFLESAKK